LSFIVAIDTKNNQEKRIIITTTEVEEEEEEEDDDDDEPSEKKTMQREIQPVHCDVPMAVSTAEFVYLE
jgi:hypothetical protein